jgi:2-polyprenyl-3-methyl-5-hydroxy-6-metoxy-1,4-benzoquinol methylase
MVHSQIMRKYGLRFDPNLRFNLYAEDLCLNAKLQHQLPSRVVHMRCCHHSLVVDMSRFPTYSHDFAVVSEKYANRGIFAGTCSIFNQNGKVNYSMMPLLQRDTDNSAAYRQPVDPRMMNHAAVRAASMMKKHGVILDVGCASGDIGRYFAEKLGATLYGFEYNQQSIEHAKSTKVYQDVLAVNLNDFDLTEYSQFYQYFDHIYCGDILEHVYDPWEVLKKLSNFLAKEGSLLVSVPNIAHCTVSANLLNNEFSYADCGILDKTHIRWFTWKSMAELFAEAGLRVIQSTATFRIPCEYDVRHMPKRILRLLPRIFEADKHALVLQYISELCPSPTSFEDLLKNNWEQLEQAPDNNTECLQGLGDILREFNESVRLSCERYPDELRATVRHYREKNDLVTALNETRLFSPMWYLEQYPEAVSANGDPLTHYLTIGWKKGYNPSMHFDTSWYLHRYPDAGKSSLCPLLHFIMLGMDKGYACNAFINNLPDTDT